MPSLDAVLPKPIRWRGPGGGRGWGRADGKKRPRSPSSSAFVACIVCTGVCVRRRPGAPPQVPRGCLSTSSGGEVSGRGTISPSQNLWVSREAASAYGRAVACSVFRDCRLRLVSQRAENRRAVVQMGLIACVMLSCALLCHCWGGVSPRVCLSRAGRVECRRLGVSGAEAGAWRVASQWNSARRAQPARTRDSDQPFPRM